METAGSNETLRALHQSLSLLESERKIDLESLCALLEAHIPSFRALLDKKPRDNNSRRLLNTGKVEIDDVQYELNAQFQENVQQLADTLDLDELEATELFMTGQKEAESLDRQPIICAIIHFHQQRSYLLDCLRITCALSLDDELEEIYRDIFVKCVDLIVKPGSGTQTASFVQRCIAAMATVEKWLQSIAKQAEANIQLHMVANLDVEEAMHIQQENLIQQHESLAMIGTYLIRSNRSVEKDFTDTLDLIANINTWNGLTVHYVPVLLAFTAYFGTGYSPNISLDEAKALNTRILDTRDSHPWPIRHLQAAFITWWLAEYNGWFFEQGAGSQADSEAEEKARNSAFTQALNDGAFQCTLSVCAFLKSHVWLDPSRLALTRSLLPNALTLPGDTHLSQAKFERIVMEQMETFVDSFITNMPDVLRTSKAEGDTERRKILAGVANGVPNPSSHFLETFFLIVSYAFEGRESAAEAFWHDPESNLYGFLQWASRRQSTPVVAAFCEMFRTISEGPRYANAAHEFLLGERTVSSSRISRASTLNWSQIFEELEIHADNIHSRRGPTAVPSNSQNKSSETQASFPATPDEISEPESNEMLECYLRLISHLCRQSPEVRNYLLQHEDFDIMEVSLSLCRIKYVPKVRSTAYLCLAALLTNKTLDFGEQMWVSVDRWITNDFCSKPPSRAGASLSIEDAAFRTISGDIEECNSFLALLQALVAPNGSSIALRDALPYPENLGSTYRLPGLDSYIDFVMGRVLCQILPSAEGTLQGQILASNVMTFAVLCLQSFNEDLVILANRSNINVDDCINASSLANYVRLHPFNRVMEWMFNERALRVLFHISHHGIAELNACESDSPLISSVHQAIRLISLILKLEPTYLNIVRPLVKAQPYSRKESVIDSSITVFEDNIATHLRIVPDLLYYTGSGHHELALASMHLLTTIMSSKRLNLNVPGRFGKVAANRLISLLQQGGDVEPIARSLIHAMEIDSRDLDPTEFEDGQQPPTYQTKMAILNLLEMTLKELPDKPNLAHVLLGLDCVDTSLLITEDGLFARGESLFHAILRTAFALPQMVDGMFRSSNLSLRQKVWSIVDLLWSSPISSAPIMADLRENGFVTSRWFYQDLISMHTSWDGISLLQGDAPFTTLVDALFSYLEQRQSLFKYSAVELRIATAQDLELARARTTSTVLGLSVLEEGDVPHLSVFDLLDFVELEFPQLVLPPLQYLQDVDGVIANMSDLMEADPGQDMSIIENLLMLKIQSLRSSGLITDVSMEAAVDAEATTIRLFLIAKAKLAALNELRLEVMKAWVNLISVLIDSGLLDDNTKQSIVLQAIQATSPKLDLYAQAGQPETLVFAQLAQTLLANLTFSPSGEESRADDGTNERLFNLFRVALRATVVSMASPTLRAVLYSICYKYLTSKLDDKVAARCMATIKTMSDSLVETISDDAYSGDGDCRLCATMLLDAITSIESHQGQSYVLDTMSKANFIGVLTEAIERMPQEVQNAPAAGIPGLLAYYRAKLSLLLTMARTRRGANEISNAGLFAAIQGSSLFATDPDIGLDIDSPDALIRYYELLRGVLRVLVAVVVSRGVKNTQSIEQGRRFLFDNRYLMTGLLKRQARIGVSASRRTATSNGQNGQNGEHEGGDNEESIQSVLNDLSELLVLLISVTGFMEEDEQQDTRRSRRKVYS